MKVTLLALVKMFLYCFSWFLQTTVTVYMKSDSMSWRFNQCCKGLVTHNGSPNVHGASKLNFSWICGCVSLCSAQLTLIYDIKPYNSSMLRLSSELWWVDFKTSGVNGVLCYTKPAGDVSSVITLWQKTFGLKQQSSWSFVHILHIFPDNLVRSEVFYESWPKR